jgi:hypothetical protein
MWQDINASDGHAASIFTSPSRWWQHGPRVHFTYPYEAFNPFLGKDHEKEEVSILQEES